MRKKIGVPVEYVVKNKRRMRRGKIAYHYRLAAGIAELIQTIPDFETQRGIRLFLDDDNSLADPGLDVSDS